MGITHSPRHVLIASLLCLGLGAFAQDSYWENPQVLARRAEFPQVAASARLVVCAWEEAVAQGDSGNIYIGMALGRRDRQGILNWNQRGRVAGPIAYAGKLPNAYSLCLGDDDSIIIAYPNGDSGLSVLCSKDGGQTFNSSELSLKNGSTLAPRVYRRSGSGYILFVTQGDAETFSLSYSLSPDGQTWGDFQPLLSGDGFSISFLPVVASGGGRDYVAFQSFQTGQRASYQLYVKTSSDSGRSWGKAIKLSDFQEPGRGQAGESERYNNENPDLCYRDGGLDLSWERGLSGGLSQVYYARLNADGNMRGQAQIVSEGRSACQNPRLFQYRGQAGLAWSEQRGGRLRAQAKFLNRGEWEDLGLPSLAGNNYFFKPANIAGELLFFWQGDLDQLSGLFVLQGDHSVLPPSLIARNFSVGQAARQDAASVEIRPPADSSGIAGYAISWSASPDSEPGDQMDQLVGQTSLTRFANSDGTWYLAVRARDYAGNWSQTARIQFKRDTTPPASPLALAPSLDPQGYLTSNTFKIDWEAPADGDVSGYSYTLSPISTRQAQGGQIQSGNLPRRILGRSKSQSFVNVENGSYLFEVAAIDAAGNMSVASRLILKANKFRPYTAIDLVESGQDDSGKLSLRILGRGFTSEGRVEELILDGDGREPFDRVFSLAAGDYRLESDRVIDGLAADDLEAGDYRLGLRHSKRGLFFAPNRLSLQAGGTVKYGYYGLDLGPKWDMASGKTSPFNLINLSLLAFLAFCAVGMLAAGRRLIMVIEDSRLLRREVLALVQGEAMPIPANDKRLKALSRRGLGLRLKFSFFVLALIVPIILMISLPLGYYFVTNQSRSLAEALNQRASVLLESLASSARSYLPGTPDYLALKLALDQTKAMEGEALYATITGYAEGGISPDVIMATNDPSVLNPDPARATKISTSTYERGVSILNDDLSPDIKPLMGRIDTRTSNQDFQSKRQGLQGYLKEYEELSDRIAERGVREQLLKKQDDINRYNEELSAMLSEGANELVGSIPHFDPAKLVSGPQDYLFYKPVLLYDANSSNYFIGLIRLGLSTAKIRDKIRENTLTLVRIVALVALVSLVFGVLGALFLAFIVIRPLRRLVTGVSIIRDTVNKEDLANWRIESGTRDELMDLSDTINQMTKGLVRGAKDNADLMAGEQDQRELLPLETDALRRKLAVGRLDSKELEFFGFYKGAKLVSGDYLDFRSLDGRYYAFIKCDVSGKGVSAAMIMAIVASVFRRWFDGWSAVKPGFKLDDLCYQVNDTLNVCEFKGKFATLMIGVIDSQSGLVHLCHSGDKYYRVLKPLSGKLETFELAGTAPAGPFPSFMIKVQSPYQVATHQLEIGEVLILYTDGIDEARRYWRDDRFHKIPRAEKEDAPDRKSGKDKQKETEFQFEDFGNERAAEIVEAIYARKTYRLTREHDPSGDELIFDFTDCEPSLENMVLGLVAVEKVFRMYRNPSAMADDQVKIDSRIDGFLKAHFKQYFLYGAKKEENPEEKSLPKPESGADTYMPHYLMYASMFEDEQYDDITVLALRRKPKA